MRRAATALLCGAAILTPSACSRSGAPQPRGQDGAARAITAMLHASAESWNRGDLEGFLDDYLDSPRTSFAGASGVRRGLDRIRESYRTGYWSSGSPKDALRFEQLEIEPLGDAHALAVGRFILSDRASGRTTSSGYFSLVLVRTGAGWKILHDHSSSSG